MRLRFTRSEFRRCLEGVSDEDACCHLEPMNRIGWVIGHLANQEHPYWVIWAHGQNLAPDLNGRVG